MVVSFLTVDLQGPVEVAKFLVPPLLDGEVSLEVLGPPLQQAGGGLFLTQLVVDLNQAWSLTPFYSVGFSQSGIRVKYCVFLQTHCNQGLCQLFLTVLWDISA